MGVKEAVSVALQFVADLYGDKVSNLQLEEVELSDDDEYWYITISFTQPKLLSHPLAAVMQSPTFERMYKRVTIETSTGNIRAMKIRDTHD